MVFRELTMDDLKDKLSIKGSLFDVLAATAEVAKEIYENEEPTKKRETTKRRKRSRERKKRFSDEDGSGSSSSTASKKKRKYNSPSRKYNQKQQETPAASLPEEVRKAISEMTVGRNSPAKLVIQKELTASDLNKSQNRLSMPINQISEEFLTEEEKQYVRGYDEFNKKNYKEVKILEPSLATETVKFCQWDMEKKGGGKTSSNYIINGPNWSDIVWRNKLRVGNLVQVWCFRVDNGDLGFALVRLPTN